MQEWNKQSSCIYSEGFLNQAWNHSCRYVWGRYVCQVWHSVPEYAVILHCWTLLWVAPENGSECFAFSHD